MNIDIVKDLSGDVFKTILIVASPALFVSLMVGLLIGLFQAVTQIQEFTLTFVPKILAVFVCLFILFPWITRVIISFTTNLIENIPMYIR